MCPQPELFYETSNSCWSLQFWLCLFDWLILFLFVFIQLNVPIPMVSGLHVYFACGQPMSLCANVNIYWNQGNQHKTTKWENSTIGFTVGNAVCYGPFHNYMHERSAQKIIARYFRIIYGPCCQGQVPRYKYLIIKIQTRHIYIYIWEWDQRRVTVKQ